MIIPQAMIAMMPDFLLYSAKRYEIVAMQKIKAHPIGDFESDRYRLRRYAHPKAKIIPIQVAKNASTTKFIRNRSVDSNRTTSSFASF